MMRQIVMVGFLQARHCTNLVGSRRHPESRRDSASPDDHREIGRVLRASGKKNPPVRDFIHFARRARPNQAIAGGPKEVADGLAQLFTAPARAGFVLAATHVPGTDLDFTQHVVADLQRRGLCHQDYAGQDYAGQDYAGTPLQENPGLERPRRGSWHARVAAMAPPA